MYKALILLLAGAVSSAAYAHNGVDHGADYKNGGINQGQAVSSAKGRHGGVVHEVHGIEYELVVHPDGVTLHLARQGKPIDTKGAMAIATMVYGGGQEQIKLFPTGGNKLESRYAGKAPIVPTTIFMNVALAGKPVVRLRFISSEFGKT